MHDPTPRARRPGGLIMRVLPTVGTRSSLSQRASEAKIMVPAPGVRVRAMSERLTETTNVGLWRSFEPPGPVAGGWLVSKAPVALIVGPYGSAKTTTGAAKAMLETCRQHPSTKDGVRRAMGVAVRQNYRRMEDTLIRSCRNFFGRDGQWQKEKNGPTNFFLRWSEAGEKHELLLQFRAFLDMEIESFVRGIEPTFWWCNEWDELPAGSFSHMIARSGRYKLDEKPKLPPPAYCRVFGDTNMPDLDNWAHDTVLRGEDEDVEVYLQPSGFSPDAENLSNLRKIRPNYYQAMAASFRNEGNEAAISRFIENKPGYTMHGKPVYPMFDSARHIAAAVPGRERVLEPNPLRPLLIGVDQGGQAAAIISQASREGLVRVFDEVVLAEGEFVGGEDFGRMLGRILKADFRRWCQPGGLRLRLDPAAKQRHGATSEDAPRAWVNDFEDGLSAELGLKLEDMDIALAVTNSIRERVQAVSKLLLRRAAEGEALVVDPRCRVLARGFSGGYRYRKVEGAQGRFVDKPEKGYYSNPHDALQYLALDVVSEAAQAAEASRDPFGRMLADAWKANAVGGDPRPMEILM